MRSRCCVALLYVCLFSADVRAEITWPQFRGPDGQGRTAVQDLPLHWDESKNLLWKTPIVGVGWSSPVVGDGKIWLTAATEVTASEDVRNAKAKGSMLADAMEVASTISLWLNQVDLATGEVLKQLKLADVESPQPIHTLNSYASPSPVLAPNRIYCYFGDYGTFCVDTSTTEIVWNKRIPLDHGVGPGSSPLLYDDLLILTCDGMDSQFVVALDATTGEQIWRTDRPPIRAKNPDYRKSFCTPLRINVGGADQLVIPGAQWCVAYEPRSGKEIWRVDHGSGFSLASRPVFDGLCVYICTGFGSDQLWAIRPDGRGDVTETHIAWKAAKQIPHMASPLVFGQRIYTVSDAGIAQCLDTATGKQIWKKRVPGKYSASPLYADRRVYVCNQQGRTTVFSAGDTYRELAQNVLDGSLMASPVVADGDLLLRTDSHLYRIGQ